MDIFLARQPIFDSHLQVQAYELLFRSGWKNFFLHSDPNEATSQVIADSLLVFGMEKLTAGCKAFINVTSDVLLARSVLLLPPKFVTVEILETVKPDKEVLAACLELKQKGYEIVLDDFVYRDELQSLMKLADIIKIDVLASNEDEQAAIIDRARPLGIRLLAEKVETHDGFKRAVEMGFTLFQGYFFSKPVILSRKDIPGIKLHYLKMFQQINRPDLEFQEIEETIKRDVSLTLKMLRYINSAFFGLHTEVHSIHHALDLLGEKEIKKWASLIAIGRMGEDRPKELVISALVRAKLCESVALVFQNRERAQDFFLMGLLSVVDALIGRPLPEVLLAIPIEQEIKAALIESSGPFSPVLEIVRAYEKGDWDRFSAYSRKMDLEEAKVPALYLQAVDWATQGLKED